jgi:farnesyl-diphosphate farnesyltransferase
VSRTFALTIPVLREPLRDEVGIAYLLCRALDTVEDHPTISRTRRDRGFECLIQALDPELRRGSLRDLQALWTPHPDSHYEDLIRQVERLYVAFDALQPTSRVAITACLREMAWGMAEFPGTSSNGEVTLACTTLEDLERYCHAAAGTVGLLLCRLFARHVDVPGWLDAACSDRGRRFGLGLQFTNVIKDRHSDRTRGISYVPAQWLEPGSAEPRVTPEGFRQLTLCALDHLAAGNRFVLGIPGSETDLRLFCLWALHLAIATLRVGAEDPAAGGRKVGRDEVMQILDVTRTHVGDDAELQTLFEHRLAAASDALGLSAAG